MVTKVGYFGLDAWHRDAFLRTLELLPVELTCACEPIADIDVEGVEGLDNIPLYDDPAELFDNEDIDIAWVALSNRDTPSVVEMAVDRDIDVFSEKTMGRTAAELEPVAKKVHTSGATVAIAYPWRFRPAARELRRLAADEHYGDLRGVNIRHVVNDLDQRLGSDLGTWVYRREETRGGMLQWESCHYIDMFEWALNDPIATVSADLTRNHPAVETEDGATVQFRTESGALGTIQAGYYLGQGAGKDSAMHIYGSTGSTSVNFTKPHDYTDLEVDSWRHTPSTSPHRTIRYDNRNIGGVPGYGGAVGLEFVERFLEAREGNVPVPAGIDDALRILRILDAIYESANSNGWVEIA